MSGSASPVVLGLCAFTHDSSAALIVDGQLVGFAEEERLSGLKHTNAYPAQTIDWLLADNKLDADDVDVVAYNYDGRRYLGALGQMPAQLVAAGTRSRAVARAASFVAVYRNYRRRLSDLRRRFPSARVGGVVHHRAHGLYAFASSGFDEAAVLVVDSLGEIQTTTLAHASRADDRACDYRALDATRDPISLGYVYGAVTQHLGWPRGDGEGTVMALAALGDPERFRPVFEQAIRLTPDGFDLDRSLFPLRVLSSQYPRVTRSFVEATCPPRQPDGPADEVHADLAAALQARTEDVLIHLARRAHETTGVDRLCLAGGVALNCVGVGRIINEGRFEQVHVPSSPGDGGTAIGAAIDGYLHGSGALPVGIEAECYLGPSYPDVRLPKEPRPGLTARRLGHDAARTLAAALADGKVVGVFQGRLEAGPRALGNRSILASPLLPDVVERLNATVKRREPFRPFAPVVPEEQAHQYFEIRQPSPYMSVAVGVTDLALRHIPTIVHANGTARVQTVTSDQNPLLAAVLVEFDSLTGVPVLINTSLNVKGKPICGTPDMALDCFASTGLDAVLIEDWWVTK